MSKKLGFAENFALSGAVAVISKTSVAPIERVKMLLQNQAELIKTGRLTEPYSGIRNCTTRTYKMEGFSSFWRGNLTNCLRYFPTQALNFAFKDKVKQMFGQKKTDSRAIQFGKNVASGGAAGGLSQCFVYSLDYARTRLTNDIKSGQKGTERQFSGLIDVYRKTFKTDGVSGLYRGFVISCVAMMLYRGFYFGLYDTFKHVILEENAGIFSSFLLGYVVTISSGIIVYPIDTVRRRMMMTSGESMKYTGSIDCTRKIVMTEGFMSLMKGAGANILRSVAGAGVLAGFDKFENIYITWRLNNQST